MTTATGSPSAVLGYGSGTAWSTTPSSAASANDGTGFSSAVPNSGSASNVLRLKGLGFSIPTGATIQGVQLDLYGSSTPSAVQLNYETVLQLVNGSAGTTADRIGSNKARGSGTQWPGSAGLIGSFGGSADLWSAALTPAIVNSANFGVDIQVGNNHPANTRTALVDYALFTVTYVFASNASATVGQVADSATVTVRARISLGAAVVQAIDTVSAATRSTAAVNIASIQAVDGFAIAIDKGRVSLTLADSQVADTFLITAKRGFTVYPDRNVTIVEIGPASIILRETAAASVTLS